MPLAVAASTASFEDLDAIDREVAAFTLAEAGMPGGAAPVDRRLRLNRCAAPLALSWRTRLRDSVLVQCPDAGGWRLFVPARGSAAVMGPPVVDRSDAVAISVTGEGFSVSRPGEALEAGAVGAWIKVRPTTDSPRSAQPLTARVVRPGLVIVPLP